MRGRILAIGDIHWCDVALTTLLDGIELTSDDTVVVLGDLIDRGPDSMRVIDRLIQLSKTLNLIGICGNHDEMLLHSLERGAAGLLWTAVGAIATLNCDGFVCIDTRAYGGLWLTCLDVEHELVWQASQTGESRGPYLLREIATSLQFLSRRILFKTCCS